MEDSVKCTAGRTMFWTQKSDNGNCFFFTDDESLKMSMRVKALECPDRVSIVSDSGDSTMIAMVNGIAFGVYPGEENVMVLEAVE